MGGPGSGPRKKGEPKKEAAPRRNRHRKTFRQAAGYDDDPPYEPPTFPRELIDQIGVFDDPNAPQTFPRTHDLKYSPELLQHLLNAVLRGISIRIVCDAVGLGERSYFRWRETRPDFDELVVIAEGMYGMQVEEKLHQIGQRDDNVLALIAAANNKLRKYGWGKGDRVDMTLRIEGGIDVNHILADPARRAAASAFEAAMQQDAIEGEIVEPKQLTDGDES